MEAEDSRPCEAHLRNSLDFLEVRTVAEHFKLVSIIDDFKAHRTEFHAFEESRRRHLAKLEVVLLVLVHERLDGWHQWNNVLAKPLEGEDRILFEDPYVQSSVNRIDVHSANGNHVAASAL